MSELTIVGPVYDSEPPVTDLLPAAAPSTEGDVHRDAWHWRAHYASTVEGEPGETLLEYDLDGSCHGFADIDQKRLVMFELMPQLAGLPPHALTLLKDSRPIFFRRRILGAGDGVNSLEAGAERVGAITCLGWQRTVGGRNVKSLSFLLEDGTVIHSDDPDAVNFGPGHVPLVTLPTR